MSISTSRQNQRFSGTFYLRRAARCVQRCLAGARKPVIRDLFRSQMSEVANGLLAAPPLGNLRLPATLDSLVGPTRGDRPFAAKLGSTQSQEGRHERTCLLSRRQSLKTMALFGAGASIALAKPSSAAAQTFDSGGRHLARFRRRPRRQPLRERRRLSPSP